MALFQAVQKIYKTMAIHPSSSQPYQFCSLNVKLQIFLIIITQTLIASTAFFLFKANTIQSLSDSFYVSLTHVFCLIYIAIKIWKVTDILQLINQYETFIQLSKLKHFLFSLDELSIKFLKNVFLLHRINGFIFKCHNVC